ncbi:hypothetical protein C4J92_0894 [Pseudomonas sp. R3-18-08]|nr:hypothetical protein C4J92_0894 [Pseudomonas sp. R3-18-08]
MWIHYSNTLGKDFLSKGYCWFWRCRTSSYNYKKIRQLQIVSVHLKLADEAEFLIYGFFLNSRPDCICTQPTRTMSYDRARPCNRRWPLIKPIPTRHWKWRTP